MSDLHDEQFLLLILNARLIWMLFELFLCALIISCRLDHECCDVKCWFITVMCVYMGDEEEHLVRVSDLRDARNKLHSFLIPNMKQIMYICLLMFLD